MVGKNLLNSIEVTSLALLERARAWEWVKDPLFARGGQGSRNKYRSYATVNITGR